MTTLAKNEPRNFVGKELAQRNALPVIAADIIYQGAAVGENGSGYARPLVSGDPFLGFADDITDNASGSAGDKDVQLIQTGRVQLAIAGLAITDIGRPVYADDDNAFSLVGDGTKIGHVVRYVSSGVGIVEFYPNAEKDVWLSFPANLATIDGAGDVVTSFVPSFNGRVKSAAFLVDVPVTTPAKTVTLNVEIGTTNVTGGAVVITSAAAAAQGALIAGSAITAANAFTASDALSIEAASVTAHAEGSGSILVCLGQ